VVNGYSKFGGACCSDLQDLKQSKKTIMDSKPLRMDAASSFNIQIYTQDYMELVGAKYTGMFSQF
jgi:hypothetical protein